MLELEVDLGGLDIALTKLDKILEEELHLALNRTLAFMEGVAKVAAPVDTGFLRASIFVVTSSINGYSLAVASAKSAAPDRLFMLAIPKPASKLEGFLVAAAEYAPNVEYGAFHARGNKVRLGVRRGRIGVKMASGGFATFTPGRLFMTEAVNQARPVFKAEASAAWRRAKMRAGL